MGQNWLKNEIAETFKKNIGIWSYKHKFREKLVCSKLIFRVTFWAIFLRKSGTSEFYSAFEPGVLKIDIYMSTRTFSARKLFLKIFENFQFFFDFEPKSFWLAVLKTIFFVSRGTVWDLKRFSKVIMLTRNSQTSGKKTYNILKEWFSFRNILRRKFIKELSFHKCSVSKSNVTRDLQKLK